MESGIRRRKFESGSTIEDHQAEYDESITVDQLVDVFTNAASLGREYRELHGAGVVPEHFTSRQYDVYYNAETMYEEGIQEVKELLMSFLKQGRYDEVIEASLRCIHERVDIPVDQLSAQSPSTALMVAEATNLLAKEEHRIFYMLKPASIVAAWKLGCQFGLGKDHAYYLGDVVAGVASFHDPDDEIAHIVQKELHEEIPDWPYEWSGVMRQDEALDLVEDRANGGEFVDNMAKATLDNEEKPTRAHLSQEEIRTQLGDIFKIAQEKTTQTAPEQLRAAA